MLTLVGLQFPLTAFQNSLTNQNLLHTIAGWHYLFPIGEMCCSVRFAKVDGVAQDVIKKTTSLASSIGRGFLE